MNKYGSITLTLMVSYDYIVKQLITTKASLAASQELSTPGYAESMMWVVAVESPVCGWFRNRGLGVSELGF